MKTKFIYLLFIVFTFSNFSNATTPKWGPTGHRVIGKIADSHLKRSTKRKIQKLLNRQTLAFVSTFADEIKSDKRYNKFYTWHYINMPFDKTYETAKKNPNGDLVTGIEFCKNIIQDKNSSDDDKAFYLKLLIHLIGDLHQPLHIGLEEDKGGNDIKLKWMYKDSNLHRVWDSGLINTFDMSYTELATNADVLTKTQIKAIQKGSIIDWVNETHEITKKIYSKIEPGKNLGYKYSYNFLGKVRSQLQIGGIRLAKILNEIL